MTLPWRGVEALGPSIAILFSCIFPQVFLEPSLPRQVPAWRLLQQQSKTMLSRRPLLNTAHSLMEQSGSTALLCPFPLKTSPLLPTWTHPVTGPNTASTGWQCWLPGNGRHPVPSSLGMLAAPAGISDDSGDFTTACRETGQFLWANCKASVKHQVPCPKWLHQPCPKATSFASSACPWPVGQHSRRSHLCAKDSAQPSSAPMGRGGTRAEPSSFTAVWMCSSI